MSDKTYWYNHITNHRLDMFTNSKASAKFLAEFSASDGWSLDKSIPADQVEQGYDGCWYEKGYAPQIPLELAAAKKHTELKTKMQALRATLTVEYDEDTFDCNQDAQANMLALLQAFTTGSTSVDIRSSSEKTHTFDQAHCVELAQLMKDKLSSLYNVYWQYKDKLYACTTVEEVESITWSD